MRMAQIIGIHQQSLSSDDSQKDERNKWCSADDQGGDRNRTRWMNHACAEDQQRERQA